MKTPISILTSLALLSGISHSQDSKWQNIIYQVVKLVDENGEPVLGEDGQQEEVRNPMDVASEGTRSSIDPIPSQGATFELWVINTETGEEFRVDNAEVGASIPKADIVIESGDSWGEVARVREDKPFKVITTYSNIQTPGEGVDSRTTEVEWIHKTLSTSIPSSDENVSLPITKTKNEKEEKEYQNTNIVPVDGVSKGIETFSVFMPDNSLPLDEAVLQVFPKPTGAFLKFGEHTPGSGKGENGTIVIINSVPRSIEFEVENMYPGGTIYVEYDLVRDGVTVPTSDTVTHTDEASIDAGSEVDDVTSLDGRLWPWTAPVDVTPATASNSAEKFKETFALTGSTLNIEHGDKLTFRLVLEDPFGIETLHEFDVVADLAISFNGNAVGSE